MLQAELLTTVTRQLRYSRDESRRASDIGLFIDGLPVIHPCVAGLDVHKIQIMATVHIAQQGGRAKTVTQAFSALPSGLADLAAWPASHQVSANAEVHRADAL